MTSNLGEDITGESQEDVDKPSDKTTGETTPAGGQPEKKLTEEIDYKTKFTESSKEAQRLLDEGKRKDAQLAQTAEVMQVLYDDPKLLEQVQAAYDGKGNPTPTEVAPTPQKGIVADKVLESKVRDTVSPLQQKVERLEKQQIVDAVDEFSQRHPDAKEGTETWKEMLKWIPAMKSMNLPLKSALEKSHEIVTVDKAKQSGKFEAVKEMYTKSQASAGGGSSAKADSGQSQTDLTSDEKKVADQLGIKRDGYAKQKSL